MKYRKFGKTGLEVSEVVFGGGYVGGILIDPDDDTKREALKRALAAGVNWIDTAPTYGNGQSEKALGWLLAELDADQQPYLSTKVRLDTSKLDDITGQIEKSLHESLTRLNRQSVDLLQLHNTINTEIDQRAVLLEHIPEIADAFDNLRSQGLIKFSGITALGDGACLIEAVNSGRFDSAQVYYNMINPSAGWAKPRQWPCQDFSGLLAACKNNGVATMNIRVFAAGVLVTDIRHGRELIVTTGSDLHSEEALAAKMWTVLGVNDPSGPTPFGTRSQTALRFALSNPDISCSVVGMAKLSHLDEAVAAPDMGPLPADALLALENMYGSA